MGGPQFEMQKTATVVESPEVTDREHLSIINKPIAKRSTEGLFPWNHASSKSERYAPSQYGKDLQLINSVLHR